MTSGRQTYQPLSDALQPYTTTTSGSTKGNAFYEGVDYDDNHAQDQEESSDPSSVESNGSNHVPPVAGLSSAPNQSVIPMKRKPGRPKGSTKRRRVDSASPTGPQVTVETPSTRSFTSFNTTVPRPAAWQHMSDADQQFYDFQWRILTLCHEFYEAASELLQSTPQDVVSRAFGLENARDRQPMDVLNEARTTCDYLLSHPASFVLSSTPPKEDATAFLRPKEEPATSGTSDTHLSTLTSLSPDPASTLVSELFDPLRPASSTSTSAANTSRPGASPHGLRQTLPQVHINQQQGTWTEEENSRLLRLAEENRLPSGEVDWDKTVKEFGVGRSRHQILIKATSLGLKPSSTRPSRQRRDHHGMPRTSSSHSLSSMGGGHVLGHISHHPLPSTSGGPLPTINTPLQSPSHLHPLHIPVSPSPLSPHHPLPSHLHPSSGLQQLSPSSMPWPPPHPNPFYPLAGPTSPISPLVQRSTSLLDSKHPSQQQSGNPFIWSGQVQHQSTPTSSMLPSLHSVPLHRPDTGDPGEQEHLNHNDEHQQGGYSY